MKVLLQHAANAVYTPRTSALLNELLNAFNAVNVPLKPACTWVNEPPNPACNVVNVPLNPALSTVNVPPNPDCKAVNVPLQHAANAV
ncbi:MAG: hypothetical protein BWY54_00617 [Candidatus Dependentiae bacterium ADurb.Bin331]|nr:MAG: hypothetical protein BWY54_00617 [Candidatus Dependentiae bacterium ADurb.Bin331]